MCLEMYSFCPSLTISESWLNTLAWLGLSVVNQCGISQLLGAGGPPKVAFGVAPPISMLSMGSGKGCCLLGLGDCLGIGVGGMVVVGCSPMQEVLVEKQVEVMEVLAQVRGGMKWSECFKWWWTAVQDNLTSSEEVINDFCSPLLWLVLLGLACICHAPYGSLQPEKSSMLQPHRWLWKR